eukprot:gene12217-13908_t
MAGRGRGATLPAWMTSGAVAATTVVQPDINSNRSQFREPTTAMPSVGQDSSVQDKSGRRESSRDRPREERSRGEERPRDRDGRDRDRERRRGSRSRSRERRERERERERDRPRRRSPSPAHGARERSNPGWRPRRGKPSNFDVRPPHGVELPPVGVKSMINGVPNSYFSFSSNPLALAGQIQQALKEKGPNYAPPPTMPAAAIASTAPRGSGPTAVDNSSATRHARRIYAGGIPTNVTEQEIVDFFNRIVTQGLYPLPFDTPPVIKAYLNLEKVFAFVEMISIELATACMALDGVRFDHWSGTYTLRVRRPNDYRPELVPKELAPIPEFRSDFLAQYGCTPSLGNGGNFGPGKLFVGGVPHNLGDEQILELLRTCGEVKIFNLVKDPGSMMSRGYCFCEYATMEQAEFAIQVLNDMVVGDRKLTVRFASQQPGAQTAALPQGGLGMSNPLLAMSNT